jgi:hypothetical protein
MDLTTLLLDQPQKKRRTRFIGSCSTSELSIQGANAIQRLALLFPWTVKVQYYHPQMGHTHLPCSSFRTWAVGVLLPGSVACQRLHVPSFLEHLQRPRAKMHACMHASNERTPLLWIEKPAEQCPPSRAPPPRGRNPTQVGVGRKAALERLDFFNFFLLSL